MKLLRLPVTVVLAFLVHAFFPPQAGSITLTAPVSQVIVPDGDEFATAVAQRPWNMSELRDIALEYGFQSVGVTNGIWTGTSAESSYYVFPLSPGFLRPNYLSYWSWYTDGMPYGPLNLLDASKYSRISFRMSQAASERNNVSIWWAKTFNTWPSAEGNMMNWYDGEPSFNNQAAYVYVKFESGYRIYDIDPNITTWYDQRNPILVLPPGSAGSAWSDNIYGFFIWPTDRGSAGANVSFDWIRVYDPDTSPVVPIRWNPISGGEYVSIQLYVDTDSSGYDGDLFVSGLVDDGAYDLKTAALPPGDYYVYLQAVTHLNSTLEKGARSQYSAMIRIGEPPIVTIVAPSFISGEDFATSELDNPWDFADSSDVELTSQMSNITYENGIFSARTDDPIPPYPESDDQIWLNTKKNGTIVPINTTKYRYFTHRIKVNEEPGYGDIFDKVARGWLSRVMWWNQDIEIDGSYSKDIPLLEGWRDYTVDLWDSTFLEVQEDIPGVPQLGWREVGSVQHIRLDPLEAWINTTFWLDYVYLTAENKPVNGSYTIIWHIADPDSNDLTVNVYADMETSSGIQESTEALVTLDQAPGTNFWTWTPTEEGGRYFIRLEVSDGSRTTSVTSLVPVVLDAVTNKPTTTAVPVSGDFDGDGITDIAVYELATGKWFIRYSSGARSVEFSFGDSSMIPVSGDFDGDGKSDLAVFQEASGYWFVFKSTDNTLAYMQFGATGYTPVYGDYDGDGITDLTLYHEASGYWFVFKSSDYTLAYMQFGAQGYRPVSGDFDGDGISDLAVFHEASGYWYVFKSSDYTLGYMQFGAAGYTPVSGDYDGDGKTDIAVYQEETGYWWMLLSGSDYTLGSMKFGAQGYTPVSGDFDGDGKSDLTVYDTTDGTWYILLSGSGYALDIR